MFHYYQTKQYSDIIDFKNKEYVPNHFYDEEKKNFVLHYFIGCEYYTFKFNKENEKIELIVLKFDKEISFEKAMMIFDFFFISLNNNKLLKFNSNNRLCLNK